MNSDYLINPPPVPYDDQHLQLFSPPSEAFSSLSNSSFSYPAQEQGESCDREQGQQHHHQQKQEAIKCVLQVRSSDHHEFLESPSLPTVENGLNNGLQVSVCERDDSGGSVKWLSSKMRLMRKMTNSNRTGPDKQVAGSNHKFQDQQQSPASPLDTDNNSTVRVCSDCNTTKTPLWRSGPRGPKSLCNACGIRQRKARRAMAAAAAASSSLLGNETSFMGMKLHEEKISDNGYVQKYKKRCKLTGPRSRKKICFEDFTINLSKNSAFHRVFPQDEKEAAILLMDLSCGLVHG